jgi:hypothetical protein
MGLNPLLIQKEKTNLNSIRKMIDSPQIPQIQKLSKIILLIKNSFKLMSCKIKINKKII